IWEEFCIYLLLSAVAYWFDYPLLIVASIIPYLFHLVMHLIFPIVKHGYVPGVVTAIIELPMTIIYLIAIIWLTNSPMWQWITVIFITFIF
ncbi:HXXEE domain-containing protein, partial [Streptomyces brasiliscabiei]